MAIPQMKEEFQAMIRARYRRHLAIIRDFVAGLTSGDVNRAGKAASQFDRVFDGWERAFRRVRKSLVPLRSQRFFRGIYIRYGDHIRQEVGNDLLLIDGLRVLLPRYNGPSRVLFRGEGMANRKRRTYGASWTASARVAKVFAEGIWRTIEGGSVLLKTNAPAIAIVAKIPGSDQEYIVDRRQLGVVQVICRFSEIDPNEYHG